MPRNISFALTKEQIRNRTKTVTRRLNWLTLKPGDILNACEKCQGIKPGESIVRICKIRVVSVRREPLRAMTDDVKYGFAEVFAEGFGEHATLRWPSVWVPWFCDTHHTRAKPCTPDTVVTRIEFEYV
jgi:hypothetical protein